MASVTQTSFNSGELSPQLYSRRELEKVYNGCKTLKNFVCLTHGPAVRRPGTEFIAETKAITTTRLIVFSFNVEQSYVLEFGNVYVRFIYDGEQIESGGSPYEVVTPYNATQLELGTAQSADTVYIAQQSTATQKLVRSGHTSWAISAVSFTSAPTEWGATYEITPGVTSTSYPNVLIFSGDRLFFSGAPAHPQHIWASQINIYNDLSVSAPVVEDDAITLKMGDRQVNRVRWLAKVQKLAVGTDAEESWITDSSGSGPVSPLSKRLIDGSAEGSSFVTPVRAGNGLLFLDKYGKILRELNYQYSTDSLESEDLIIMANHLTKTYGIVRMAFQKNPHKILWCVRDDGDLIGLTYYPKHKVWGWHHHDTTGEFQDVVVVPGSGEDDVYFIVKREINGSTSQFIEKLKSWEEPEDTEDSFFVDCGLTLDNRIGINSLSNANPAVMTATGGGVGGLITGDTVRLRDVGGYVDSEGEGISNDIYTVTISGSNIILDDLDGTQYTALTSGSGATFAKNVTTISGLDHLEAEEVTVLADGYADTYTVSSGSITLNEAASLVHVGLSYTSDLVPLLANEEDSPGLDKRVTSVKIELYNTLGLSVGPDEDNLGTYDFVDDSVPLGQPGDLFTGWTDEIGFEGSFSTEPDVMIRQDQPLPCTVLAVHAEIETGDAE